MIRSFAGLRGFAACWVLLYHLRHVLDAGFPHWTGLRSIVGAGYLGVDLFALLSGFVISLNYAERLSTPSASSTGRFLWLRLARIYPLLVFALVPFVVARGIAVGVGGWPAVLGDRSLWLQVLMLNGWGLESEWGWNTPSWTVSAEWLCYLIFPLLAPMISRVQGGRSAAVLAALTIAATAGLLHLVGKPRFGAFLDWGAVRIGGEFLTGCWLCRAHRAGAGRRLPWDVIGVAAACVGLYFSVTSPTIAVFSFAVWVYALAYDEQPLRGILGNRVATYLGEISYSIYLMQWFVVTDLKDACRPLLEDLPPGVTGAVLAVTVLLLASLTHFAIERPARSRMRALVGAA